MLVEQRMLLHGRLTFERKRMHREERIRREKHLLES
jgi:hypothetical protein